MRLVIYDATAGWLSFVWRVGAVLLAALGRYDAVVGVRSWGEAQHAITATRGRFRHVEVWGHGRPGAPVIDSEPVAIETLAAIGTALAPSAVIWYRSCSVFQGERGQTFAAEAVNAARCTIAAHTFITWIWHSGLRTLAPGETPRWSPLEGVDAGGRGRWSGPWHPATITFLGRGPFR